jgi:PPK2 family polyphosphate:nucleotide phosphotransferase
MSSAPDHPQDGSHDAPTTRQGGAKVGREFGDAGWRGLRAKIARLRIKPGARVDLGAFDPDDKLGFEKDDAPAILEGNRAAMEGLHELLWASCTRSLLVVLQGMDTSGKDGVIKHVLTGLNPQGCRVTSFKVPSEEESRHDFLWRIHKAAPARGEVGIFNRSHYEGVLVERVEELTPEAIWKKRYDQINQFEALLSEGGTRVVKMFLNISKGEQKERLEARLDDATKNWKFSEHDLVTRSKWREYARAFEDLLSRCSTRESPWYVVPGNRKWSRNIAASAIIRHELEAMDLKWPEPKLDVKRIRID